MFHLRKVKLIFISVLTGLNMSLSQTSYSGDLNFYFLSALNDNHLINLPYRILDLNIQHQHENMEIISNLAMEYSPQSHTHFLSNSNPQDFLWDLRELYMAWYIDFGEIRLGKQIHTWGSVDENSPIDVVNAFDYYYLFFQGADRKLGSYSAAIDIYFNDWKIGAVFSPFHHTNRFPVNNPEFPIHLPVTPKEHQILFPEKRPYEYGAFIEYSHNYGDVRLSYFNGYDRTFNLSGLNAFNRSFERSNGTFGISDEVEIDTVFSYRKTKMVGIGGTLLFGDLILRNDFSYFKTQDLNDNVQRDFHPGIPAFDSLHVWTETANTTGKASYPFHEDINYYQNTLQIEYGLPWDITIIGQLFLSDTIQYNYTNYGLDTLDFGEVVDTIDVDPSKLFSPGMGTPLAALTKKALTLSLEKTFLEDQLKINLMTMIDLHDPSDKKNLKLWGRLIGLTVEYELTQDMNIIAGLTQIRGDENHPLGEAYRFNHMEDFSHLRFELKYSF